MPTSYKHFSTDERECLLVMLTKKWTQSEMARKLRRSESSISRELRRNRDEKGKYSPAKAADAYKQRRKKCGRPKKLNDPKLKKIVEERLEMNWSPEQIDGRFRLETGACQISYATIYRAYINGELYVPRNCFRRKRRPATPHNEEKRGRIHEYRSIIAQKQRRQRAKPVIGKETPYGERKEEALLQPLPIGKPSIWLRK